ncbi:MAG: pantoate--beta-alanine ligase, partial [Fibrobacteraceae bacterium]|nr:pantoate--beta-alanine ligase [Fibrobacteraceae bacterium]
MKIVKTISELRAELLPFKMAGKSIGLVPTMGALHEGHASLIDASARENDVTVVSVFVNPIQFGKTEDLDKYPRRLAKDAELGAAHGASFV